MRGLAAAGACSALLLTACSGDSRPPTTLPPLSSSPTPSPTAEATPSGINAPDAFGASAFARYFFAEVNAAYRVRQPDRIRALAFSDCETCNNFVLEIEGLLEKSHRYVGGDFMLLFAEATPPQRDVAIVDVAYTTSETSELDESGRVVRTIKSKARTSAQLRLDFLDGSWRVRAMREVTV